MKKEMCLFWSIAAAVVFISCFLVNVGGAWFGYPAGIGHLIMTIFYVVFWGLFSFISRRSRILFRVSAVMGLLTFVSSVICLMAVLFRASELLVVFAVLLAVFSAVPMYGLRVFLDWTQLYAAAAALSFFWLIFTGVTLRMQNRT